MEYLFFQLWPVLLVALILGMLFGYYTCSTGPSRRPDRR